VLDFSDTTNFTFGSFYLAVGIMNTIAFAILVHFMNKYFDSKHTEAQRKQINLVFSIFTAFVLL